MQKKKKKRYTNLLFCLQWLLTKTLSWIIIPSKEIVSNSHDIWHKKLRNYPLEQFLMLLFCSAFHFLPFGPKKPPTEHLPLKCCTFSYVVWVTSWFSLNLPQTASEISKLWITSFIFVELQSHLMFKAAASERKDCQLVLPRQDQTKNECNKVGEGSARAWVNYIQSISHSDENFLPFSFLLPRIFMIFFSTYLIHNVQNTGELCRITAYHRSQYKLWLSEKFSQSSKSNHCFVWRSLYFISHVSTISLPVKQFSYIWLAVIIILFDKSLINPLYYICGTILARKHCCWIQSCKIRNSMKKKDLCK